MSKKTTIIIITAAVVLTVAGIVYANYDRLFNNTSVQPPASSEQADAESATYKQYAAMTGETYDRNFLANMIAHHQGAVDMAKMAVTSAKHQELKDMANAIITAQEQEIAQMTAWQKEWGYPSTSADNMMDHSAMGMMDEMAGMSAELEGKTGDDFDKAFIEQMIMHHQSAIDMATPGAKNAYRQEVKTLSKAIVSDQTKEIEQMKQWQINWGYAIQ